MRKRRVGNQVRAGQDRVALGDTVIEFAVRRSRRRKKTVQITVDGEGVRVAAPWATPDREIRAFVEKRADWIVRQLAEAERRPRPPLFVTGDTLPYLGRPTELTVEPGDVAHPQVSFDDGRLIIAAPRQTTGDGLSQLLRRAVVEWYGERAAELLPACVDEWLPRLADGERPRILIRDQRKRWGSCAADGTLRFNWRLVMLEPALIEYVVVHELAHLTVKNHSADFWKVVAGVLPDVKERRQRLREAEKTLPM